MKKQAKKAPLKGNVVLFGWTSFFEDISSQMNYSILPLFLANTLGVNKAFIGLIEGIAETTASFLKIFIGWLSDKLKLRKVFVVTGYAVTALSRPFLSFANKGFQVLGLRFMDRTGKGIRTSPRDALIADSCEESDRGRAFGFHRSLDTAGAIVGPLLAFIFLSRLGMSYRAIFLISVIPAIIATILVLVSKETKGSPADSGIPKPKISIGAFPADFKKFIFVVALFTLGNSSDAFLILRANNIGISPVLIPVLWVVFNITYAVSALPSGILSDRIGSRRVIAYGFLIYSVVYLGFAFATSAYQVWILFLIYGFYYGLTDGVSRSLVSKMVSSEQRGTAFGIYHSTVGLVSLPASLLMGFLWDWKGPKTAFLFGAVLALVSVIMLFSLIRIKNE